MYELILEIRVLAENLQPQEALKIILVSICVFCLVLYRGGCKAVWHITKKPQSLYNSTLPPRDYKAKKGGFWGGGGWFTQ